MSQAFDSVYPDLLRTGLERLNSLPGQRELAPLFAALEHLRQDLHTQDDSLGVLQVTQRYVGGLNLFHAAGFFLVNPTDLGFDLALCGPEADRPRLEGTVNALIRDGRFAWALRRTASVCFRTGPAGAIEHGVLHTLAVPSQVMGMFCGLLQEELDPTREIAFNLLSVLLGASADALSALRKTTQLANEIKTLTGLMPMCAWCKKIRDDRGYWDQIEAYLETHSGASVSHGICPECEARFFASPGRQNG
jgi:hypothetical protein